MFRSFRPQLHVFGWVLKISIYISAVKEPPPLPTPLPKPKRKPPIRTKREVDAFDLATLICWRCGKSIAKAAKKYRDEGLCREHYGRYPDVALVMQHDPTEQHIVISAVKRVNHQYTGGHV